MLTRTVGFGSLVDPPLDTDPVWGATASVTEVIVAALGAVVSRVAT